MRILRCLPPVLLVLIVLACGTKPLTWKTYHPTGTKAEIQFPGDVKEVAGKDNTHLTLETLRGRATYMLMYSPLPVKNNLEPEVVKPILANVASLSAGGVNGKVISQRDTNLGKYPGRTFDLDVPKLGIYRARIFLTRTTMYQVVVLGPKDFVDGADAARFFESFKLLD